MSITLNSFVWPSMGIEPPSEEDAIYSAGEQPIAGFDNHIMWAVTSDLKSLRDWTAAHGHVHEAGGAQEIDLDGLGVGTVATLETDETANELRFHDPDGVAFVRYDVDDDLVREFPTFGTRSSHREGIDLGNDIVRGDGTVIYDHATDYFHRAETADTANYADEAGDADTVDGYHADAFIMPSDDVEATGWWTFTKDVDANITGNAATATHADEADHATTADEADLALDSNLHEGYTVQEILDMVENDLLEGSRADVADDGTTKLTDAETLNFGTSIDVSTSGNTATMDVTSVPFAQESEYANNSDKVDGWHAQELLDEAASNVDEKLVDVADDGTQIIDGADRISFDNSMDVTQKAPGVAGVDVDSVPHADKAEYAVNADKVDDYHAQDLINMMANAGRWSHIGNWQVGPGSDLRWAYDIPNGDQYHRYRMLLIFENLETSGGQNDVWLRLNNDTRNRYDYTKRWIPSGADDHQWETNQNSGNGWPLAEAPHQRRAVAEYEIVCPPTMGLNGSYPTISELAYGGDVSAKSATMYGQLTTRYDAITDMELRTFNQDGALYVQLWGADTNL